MKKEGAGGTRRRELEEEEELRRREVEEELRISTRGPGIEEEEEGGLAEG